MSEFFAVFKGFWVWKKKEARIEDFIFLLHTKFTKAILYACAFAVSLIRYFGDPIHCQVDGNSVSAKVMNAYCWLNIGSYVLANEERVTLPNGMIAHPGVRPLERLNGDQIQHQGYYQWIWLLLCIQAFLFSLPRKIWKYKEGGLMTNVSNDIDNIFTDEEEKMEKKKRIVVEKYVQRLQGKLHDGYAKWFIFCEILNFLNIISQFIFMNLLLDNHFFNYGIKVLRSSEREEMRIMDSVFPKVAKCHFSRYGPSGNLVQHDAICVLAINVVNERIYLLLWFWFVFLVLISFVNLVFRALVTVNIGNIRCNLLLRLQGCTIDPHVVYKLNQKLLYGDWFVLNLMTYNVDPLMFRDLIELTERRFKGEDIKYKKPLEEKSKV